MDSSVVAAVVLGGLAAASAVAAGVAALRRKRQGAPAPPARTWAPLESPPRALGDPGEQPLPPGATVYQLQPDDAEEVLGLEFEETDDGAVVVSGVIEGSPYARAGGPGGVRLLSIAGIPVAENLDSLGPALRELRQQNPAGPLSVVVAPAPAQTPAGSSGPPAAPPSGPHSLRLLLLNALGLRSGAEVYVRAWGLGAADDAAAALRHPPGLVGLPQEWPPALVSAEGEAVWCSARHFHCSLGEAAYLRLSLRDAASGAPLAYASFDVRDVTEAAPEALEVALSPEGDWAPGGMVVTVSLEPDPPELKRVYFIRPPRGSCIEAGSGDPALRSLTEEGLTEVEALADAVADGTGLAGGLQDTEHILAEPSVAGLQSALVGLWNVLPNTKGVVVAPLAVPPADEPPQGAALLRALIGATERLYAGVADATRELLGSHPVDLSLVEAAGGGAPEDRAAALAANLLASQHGTTAVLCQWEVACAVVDVWQGGRPPPAVLQRAGADGAGLLLCELAPSAAFPLLSASVGRADTARLPPAPAAAADGQRAADDSPDHPAAPLAPPRPPQRRIAPAPPAEASAPERPPPRLVAPSTPVWRPGGTSEGVGVPLPTPPASPAAPQAPGEALGAAEAQRLIERVLPAAAAALRKMTVTERAVSLAARERAAAAVRRAAGPAEVRALWRYAEDKGLAQRLTTLGAPGSAGCRPLPPAPRRGERRNSAPLSPPRRRVGSACRASLRRGTPQAAPSPQRSTFSHPPRVAAQ
eukprot:TRINITY_DN8070_c4_g1_i1.p1 TRINITY_DN8070_c4_g1~~TRINITY_DN8070_c4_g1_i1.p1  ORF type:complete len:782 (+),score=204.08 TRINITY_DN8070_c4_g1_i1:75-2348(+)